MRVILTGFMGTGKTVVGRRVASALKVPFHDVDETIVREAGCSISELFAREGESGFRQRETAVIRELTRQDRVVLATGGGSFLSSENRALLEHDSRVVCLTAQVETLVQRLGGDAARPLLAGGDLAQRIRQLLKEREALYKSFPLQVATDGKTVAQVAEEVIKLVG